MQILSWRGLRLLVPRYISGSRCRGLIFAHFPLESPGGLFESAILVDPHALILTIRSIVATSIRLSRIIWVVRRSQEPESHTFGLPARRIPERIDGGGQALGYGAALVYFDLTSQ
jgi:hypothetical protein